MTKAIIATVAFAALIIGGGTCLRRLEHAGS